MNNRNQFHFFRKELSKLLKASGKVSFHKDEIVLNRMIDILSEGKSFEKIIGLIATTEIAKYGGDISDYDVEILYNEIINWWEEKDEYAT